MPSYVLVLKVETPLILKVGSLGAVRLEPGLYAYVGSGGRNLRARVVRHARLKSGAGKVKWHVDYLLTSTSVKLVGALLLPSKSEHEAVAAVSEVSSPTAKGFGSSDCRCYSHLFKLPSLDALDPLLSEPNATFAVLERLSAF